MSLSRSPLLLAAVLFAGSPATPARADQLDRDLLRRGGQILYRLDDLGYRCVGVLPFQVVRGNRQASSQTSPLALNLATRLENTLILSQDPAGKTIKVIRAASATASRRGASAYQTSPAAFRKLFELDYTPAWGSKKVKANAFLTGRVINQGKDRSKTTVIIEAFDATSRKDGKLVKARVLQFDVATDRALLTDLGYGWSLSPVVLRRGYNARERDRLAVRQVTRRDEEGAQQPQPGQSNQFTPVNLAGFTFEISYNGEKQEITSLSQRQQGQRLPLYQVPPAPPGAKIVLTLTRKDDSDRMLGVVLKVNGQSTWKREDGENSQCKKWLYGSERVDKPDRFLGFYMDTTGKNLRKFKSLTPEESEERANQLGARVGWIDIEVFASSQGQKDTDDEEDGAKFISARSLGPRPKKPRTTLRAVQAALSKANRVKVKQTRLPAPAVLSRDVIDADVEASEGGDIQTGSLPNPESLGGIAIRYWERGKQN
jgi:hypothetical protein